MSADSWLQLGNTVMEYGAMVLFWTVFVFFSTAAALFAFLFIRNARRAIREASWPKVIVRLERQAFRRKIG